MHRSEYLRPDDPDGDVAEDLDRLDRLIEKSDPGPFPGARRDYETTDLEGAAQFERNQQQP